MNEKTNLCVKCPFHYLVTKVCVCRVDSLSDRSNCVKQNKTHYFLSERKCLYIVVVVVSLSLLRINLFLRKEMKKKKQFESTKCLDI